MVVQGLGTVLAVPEEVVVSYRCLGSLRALLNHEYVEVVDALDVLSRCYRGHVERVEEPSKEDLGLRVRVVEDHVEELHLQTDGATVSQTPRSRVKLAH